MYDRLRRGDASKNGDTESQNSLKRQNPSEQDTQESSFGTSPKKTKTSNSNLEPWKIDPYDPPIAWLLSPSQARTSLGPTPQKNGTVLGLFDGLSSQSGGKTPSKRKALAPVTANIQATPSKERHVQQQDLGQIGMSKDSAGKNPQPFLTPSRRKENGLSPFALRSVSKIDPDDTPAFLRRGPPVRGAMPTTSLNIIGEASWSPVAVRKLALPPIGRGFSALVKDLRDMEDERLDEELDIMNEMEADSDRPNAAKVNNIPTLLVEDSQPADMPLGPDQAPESEEAEDPKATTGDGRPLKVWKKKGQKRTTRKSNMKPSTAKWKPEVEWKAGTVEDSTTAGQADAVEETQMDATALRPDDASDFEASNSDRAEAVTQRRATEQSRGHDAEKRSEKGGGDSQTVRKKRKVSATAHANYRSLKIKNKNSKAKGGRFRRGR